MVSATETARKFFGAAIFDTTSFKKNNISSDDLNSKLRLHIFQLNKKLEINEAKIKSLQFLNLKNENALEQKDLVIAKLNVENQNFKKVFFYILKICFLIYAHIFLLEKFK